MEKHLCWNQMSSSITPGSLTSSTSVDSSTSSVLDLECEEFNLDHLFLEDDAGKTKMESEGLPSFEDEWDTAAASIEWNFTGNDPATMTPTPHHHHQPPPPPIMQPMNSQVLGVDLDMLISSGSGFETSGSGSGTILTTTPPPSPDSSSSPQQQQYGNAPPAHMIFHDYCCSTTTTESGSSGPILVNHQNLFSSSSIETSVTSTTTVMPKSGGGRTLKRHIVYNSARPKYGRPPTNKSSSRSGSQQQSTSSRKIRTEDPNYLAHGTGIPRYLYFIHDHYFCSQQKDLVLTIVLNCPMAIKKSKMFLLFVTGKIPHQKRTSKMTTKSSLANFHPVAKCTRKRAIWKLTWGTKINKYLFWQRDPPISDRTFLPILINAEVRFETRAY